MLRHFLPAAFALLSSCVIAQTTHLPQQFDGARGGAPVNDHCGDVAPIALPTGDTLIFTGTTIGATVDGDYEPGSVLDNFGIPVVWLSFTTAVCSDVTVSYCGSPTVFGGSFWEVLAFDCPAGNDLAITSDYVVGGCPDGNSTIRFNALVAGTHYYPVYVDPDGPTGEYVITVSSVACGSNPVTPPNDECAGTTPQNVVVGDTIAMAGDNTGATDSEALGFNSVWGSFTIGTCATVTVDYCGTAPAFSAFAYGLYKSCPAEAFVDTTSTSTCGDGNLTEVFAELAPGTYYIPVRSETGTAEGPYSIHVSAVACIFVPPNDACSGASVHVMDIGDTLTIQGDNTGATDGEGLGYNSVWEAFTLPSCANVQLSYCGTTPAFGNVIDQLYVGCASDSLVSADGSSWSACGDGNAMLTYLSLAAGTYYIPVLMEAGVSEGLYTITVTTDSCTVPVVPPANDECANATVVEPVAVLDCPAAAVSGNNTNATQAGAAPVCGAGADPFQDVWYMFNSGVYTQAIITTAAGTIGAHGMEVFLTCEDTSLFCSLDDGEHVLAVTSGTDYLVRVFSYGDAAQQGTFTLCIAGDIGTGTTETHPAVFGIHPVPGNGDVTLTYVGENTDAVLTVLDMTGRAVHQEHVQLFAGQQKQLSLAGLLAKGSYVLQLSTAEGTSVQRMVVDR